jgi:hypothetical protein
MKAIAAILALLLACCPTASRAEKVTIQAESYSSSLNLDWDSIRSFGGRLYGLGAPGEWTQYTFTMSAFGTYGVMMLCWGELNTQYSLSLTYYDDAGLGEQTIYFSFTGRGDCNH